MILALHFLLSQNKVVRLQCWAYWITYFKLFYLLTPHQPIFQVINNMSFKKESQVPLKDLNHDIKRHCLCEFELQCNVQMRHNSKSRLLMFLPGCKKFYILPVIYISTTTDILIMSYLQWFCIKQGYPLWLSHLYSQSLQFLHKTITIQQQL